MLSKKEKMFILDKCIDLFEIVLICKEKYTFPKYYYVPNYYIYLGKALALKTLIEDLIDCQPPPYYEKYSTIVDLYQKTK